MNAARRRASVPRPRRYAFAATALALLVGLFGAVLSGWMTQSDPQGEPTIASQGGRDEDFAAIFDAAVAQMQAGRQAEALELWHRALRLEPEMPEVAVNMGFTLLELGEVAAARDLFVGAVELDAYQANAYFGLAIASEALGDLPGAMGAMRSYLHLATGPGDEAYRRRARAALWEWEAEIARRAEAKADASGSTNPPEASPKL